MMKRTEVMLTEMLEESVRKYRLWKTNKEEHKAQEEEMAKTVQAEFETDEPPEEEPKKEEPKRDGILGIFDDFRDE